MKNCYLTLIISLLCLISIFISYYTVFYLPVNTENKIINNYVIRSSKDITHSYNCTLTAYSADVRQTNQNPYTTALMERPVVGGTVAVSQDLKKYLGNKIYISGHGVFRVNDLMNKRYERRIDLFVKDKRSALEFGKKENVLVIFF